MFDVQRLPTLSNEYASRDNLILPEDAVYVFGQSIEERSHLSSEWQASQTATFIKIDEEEYQSFAFRALGNQVQLRSATQLEAFLDQVCLPEVPLFLDITGLSHHVWAPLVARVFVRLLARGSVPSFRVVYVEPRHYRKSTVPRPGDIFALSEKCHGIRPLPGMLRLRRHYVEAKVLVVLLGFEGWRFDAVLATFEPDAGSVIPIIGLPGYRAEYPFYTVEGNLLPLDKDDNWIRRRFAKASDPFEVFAVLTELAGLKSGLRIAMVGTKPHSLGAVLFAAAFPDRGELVYDNPIRSAGRTDQGRRVQVYDLSSFAEYLVSHHEVGSVVEVDSGVDGREGDDNDANRSL